MTRRHRLNVVSGSELVDRLKKLGATSPGAAAEVAAVRGATASPMTTLLCGLERECQR